MGTGFILLEAAPGRERDIYERMGRLPEIRQRQVLFGSAIALRVEAASLPRAVARLRRMSGVRDVRLYPAGNS